MSTFGKIIWGITGIFLIILGATIISWPLDAIFAMGTLLALALIISGISNIISYYRWKDLKNNSGCFFADGIISIFLGIGLLLNNNIAFIPFIFAFWVFLSGVFRFFNSFKLKELNLSFWWIYLLSGILLIILGVVAFISPIATGITLSWLLGLLIIMQGISAFTTLIAYWDL